MSLEKVDNVSQNIALTSVVFGIIALVFACVGVATPNWESTYTTINSVSYTQAGTANFFYTCYFNNGTHVNCTYRTTDLVGYPRYSPLDPWMSDYNLRIRNAGALCIIGIIFLAFGTAMVLVMAITPLTSWMNLISPGLILLACLFMVAGMAEGAHYLVYNDYSANFYQTALLFTIFTLFLSSLTTGRVQFLRKKEKENARKTITR